MTWLFPLYLLGAAAIVAPILMHLRRKPPQNRVEFSSLMFLEAQTPVPVSKRRLEHWLLLLLRCLVLLLLALMFARPLWRGAQDQTPVDDAATAILIDRSASMQRGDLWQRAVAEATGAVQAARPEDRVAAAAFDGGVHPLWSFDQDAAGPANRTATLKQRLAEMQPGWDKTDLGKALTTATEWFSSAASTKGRKKHILVITDLQEGAHLEALRSMVWPEDIAVSVKRLEAPDVDNLSVALAASSDEEAVTEGANQAAVRVRLANVRDSKVSDFSLDWEPGGAGAIRGYLPPGSSRVLVAPPKPDSGAPQVLRISGDKWDFDNRVYAAPLQPKKARLAFIGDEKSRHEAAAPLYYLSRALQPTPAIAPELLVIPSNDAPLPATVDMVFAAEVTPQTQRLRKFIEQGGLAVQVVDAAAAQKSLQTLTGVSDLTVQEAETTGDGYLMLGEVNAAHPLLRPFADPRLRDFTKLRFWKHRRLALGAQAAKQMQVIAKFDNGDPAIVACPIGQGTLILLASGWQPADSQLALSTKFVPLLYGWLEAAGFQHEETTSLQIGDAIPAAVGATVTTPAKETLTVAAGAPVMAALPGFYSVQQADAPKAVIYAVNLAPEESRILPMEPDQLRELGPRLESADRAAQSEAKVERERLAASEEEMRQRAWLWILAGLLAVLGAETWVAGRIKTRGEVLVSST